MQPVKKVRGLHALLSIGISAGLAGSVEDQKKKRQSVTVDGGGAPKPAVAASQGQ